MPKNDWQANYAKHQKARYFSLKLYKTALLKNCVFYPDKSWFGKNLTQGQKTPKKRPKTRKNAQKRVFRVFPENLHFWEFQKVTIKLSIPKKKVDLVNQRVENPGA